MPEAVDNCVESILDDNPDMDESTAFAICQDMDNRGVLEAWLEADPDPDARAMARFENPSDIRRVDESGDAVRYKRVMLISPGTWGDAGSGQYVDYQPEALRASADNWVDIEAVREHVPEWGHLSNEERAARLEDLGEMVALDEAAPINFLHGPGLYGAESLDEIGDIPLDSIIVDDDGALYGDLVLHGDSPQSEAAIDLVDETLEKARDGADPPPVGPSVEIPADRVEEDGRGGLALQEAFFSAAGVVFNPASRPVELGAQARDRAVAMTSEDDETGGVVYRHADGGDTLKAALRHRWRMADDTGDDPPAFEDMDDDELARTLEAMREDMGELEAVLQGPDEMMAVMDAVQEFASAGEDLSAGADAFRDWAAANVEIDENALDDVLSAYLDAVDADDLSETPVEQFQAWLAEQVDGEGEGNGGDGEDEEGEVSMEDLEAVKQVVGEVSQHLGDIKDLLTAREDDVGERFDELERRLTDIEEDPDPRSLAEGKIEDFYEDGGGDGADAEAEHEDVFLG